MFIKIGSIMLLIIALVNHVDINNGIYLVITGKYWTLSLIELIAGITLAFIVKKENKQLVS
ncbi:hypothetical protein [Persephonella sp. KM09-Lau-8]|uniref:hypothetical protein n=1 Tax=Persephonella sp. KM09-Lau-8 TaxID=1158345 RepID=UPI000495F0C5|nr:hypothetical protein [Persephonella sp. KM09-Lau-8]